MRLRDRVVKGGGATHEFPVEVTWERISGHLRRIGVTRLADLTGLDRLGIPVYNAISPRSNDIISVYNGKGVTPLAARTSAAMEAVERFSAWLPVRPAAVASYAELAAADRPVLDPREHSFAVVPGYRDDGPISWVEGWDLLSECTVLVPHDAAVYQRRPHEQTPYPMTTTNGLASGNSLEEAICHALCELVERDAMTLAELISHRLSQSLVRTAEARGTTVDVTPLAMRHPRVDLAATPPGVQAVADRFHQAGLEVRLIRLTSDLGVPTYFATNTEDFGPTMSTNFSGIGTHPNAEVAMMRAITECAQGRAVDIQAMREDLVMPTDPGGFGRPHERSVMLNRHAWIWQDHGDPADGGADESFRGDDVMADLRFILDRLRAAGIRRAIAVDLSPPGIPVKVVRMIVPGLESWAIDRSKIGARATAAWNAALREVRRESVTAG
ncbi:YcaO-like family protein [Plantactinospora solaniradicis]|uniref:YcaO-like family protein n=1 Tax=Plantactinospora solaniradicis TaxID=1723736 RepID=A0ABW1K646_9ACTN